MYDLPLGDLEMVVPECDNHYVWALAKGLASIPAVLETVLGRMLCIGMMAQEKALGHRLCIGTMAQERLLGR